MFPLAAHLDVRICTAQRQRETEREKDRNRKGQKETDRQRQRKKGRVRTMGDNVNTTWPLGAERQITARPKSPATIIAAFDKMHAGILSLLATAAACEKVGETAGGCGGGVRHHSADRSVIR